MPTASFPRLQLSIPVRHRKDSHITAALRLISAVKSQLYFHAIILQRHSPTLLFLLERFTPSDIGKRGHWARFQPYSLHHLQILINVFARTLLGVERDEHTLLRALGSTRRLLSHILTDEVVEEVLMRWPWPCRQSVLSNRWIGRLILKSYTVADKRSDGYHYSCRISDLMELLAVVWHEEVERDYYNVFPEEMRPGGDHEHKDKEDVIHEVDDEVRFPVETDELGAGEGMEGDDEGDYKGPSYLKRMDDGTLGYKS
ncbi:hypothetical protein Dda_5612 [Drechslerella dactyloides]|uniref:Uncharacterized protein n=1 Tax=Drechslerella dactyloides TaxID=74499 RepID=A0AAD6IWE8_DREDA|nr:hypothetical protein Dda_5612 [Drechslerella dactyloides]